MLHLHRKVSFTKVKYRLSQLTRANVKRAGETLQRFTCCSCCTNSSDIALTRCCQTPLSPTAAARKKGLRLEVGT